MTAMSDRAGLKVADTLAQFIEQSVLPGTGLEAGAFWRGVAAIFARFVPENRVLLMHRDALQARIDDWHRQRRGQDLDMGAYRQFLGEIGYLKPEPAPFTIATAGCDAELAHIAGPQLVVPVLNARFVLNAANARWGSLYDALYGTDALPHERAALKGYDPKRGAAVIANARAFLDKYVPLAAGSYADVDGFRIVDGELFPALKDKNAFAGYQGEPAAPSRILLKHHGLHIQLVIDRAHPIGKTDKAGLADVILEAALTTIVDLEDSVAAVDADDKVAAYGNWLGLIKGTLKADFDKGGKVNHRTLNQDISFTAPDGGALTLPGRSLLFIRNVGHLMTSDAILLPSEDGNGVSEIGEGLMDGVVTSLIGCISHRAFGSLAGVK